MEGARVAACPDSGTNKFSHPPHHRFGDLFPLPRSVDEGYAGELNLLGSRRSRQRVHRRRTLVDRERGSIWALNSLAGFSDPCSWPSEPLNSAQRRALQHTRRAHRERPPPSACESPQAALRLLCKKAGTSYSGDQPGQLASYERSKLSLPRGQQDPTDLACILPPSERHRLENFETEMLLSAEEAASVLEVGLEGECYVNPILGNNPQKYHESVSPRSSSGNASSLTLVGQTVFSGRLHLHAWDRSSRGPGWRSREAGRCSWFYLAHQVHVEVARSVLGAVKHRCRDAQRHGKRITV